MDVSALISLYTNGLTKQTNNQAIDTSNTTGDFASYLNNAITNNTSLESLLQPNLSSDFLNVLTNNSTISDPLSSILTNALSSTLTNDVSLAKTNLQQSYSAFIQQIGDNASPELLAKKEQFEVDLNNFENIITTEDASSSLSSISNFSNPLSSSFNGLDSLFSSNETNDTNVDNSLGDMLTSSFQTELMSNLTIAKSKMQQGYVDYVSRIGDNPSEAAIARIEEMKTNMQSIDQFLSFKATELNAKQAYTQHSKENITAQLNVSSMNGLF